jgi:hypothetical protein
MPNAKLKIAAITDFQTTIGMSTADYAVFQCSTEQNDLINVAITHNALAKKAGIRDVASFDSLVGSTIIATKSTDPKTGLIEEADERLQNVLNGTYGVLLLNSSNCAIAKSELLTTSTQNMQANIQARLIIEKEKEAKLVAMQRAQDRFAAKLAAQKAQAEAKAETPSTPEVVADDAVVVESEAAPLEF